jgi:hypothetical protein
MSGRMEIHVVAVSIGSDLSVTVFGGQEPHIGCVTLSIPRPSLDNPDIISSTTSVLNLTGHKDDDVAKYMSHMLSSRLKRNVVVTGGIHVDEIRPDEIEETRRIIKDITEEMTNMLI